MCLVQQKETRRMEEDRYFWKVFEIGVGSRGFLTTIHSREEVLDGTFSSKGRHFERQYGFQVFLKHGTAMKYSELLTECNARNFTVRKVLVRRGAKIRGGRIDDGFIFAGKKAYRVSSLTIVEEEKR